MFGLPSKQLFNRAVVSLILIILFGVIGFAGAQDAPAADIPVITDTPTDVSPTSEPVTEVATTESTLAPTEDATVVPPTALPTAAPTDAATEVATQDVSPTPTLDVPASPTLIPEPPSFNLDGGFNYEITAGMPLLIDGSVVDSLGMVRIVANASSGAATVTTIEPTESNVPYTTTFQINYLAQVDFVGTDMLTLTGINPAGVESTAMLTINVVSQPVIVTPTLEPTPVAEPMKELLIKYDPAASEESIQKMLAVLGAIEEGRLPQIGVMRVLVPESVSQPSDTVARVQSSGVASLAGVTSAEENITYHLAYTPTDPLFPQQWGLTPNTNVNSPGGIYAPYAWDISTTRGTGVKVAVIDSGVDLQHPDLLYQFVPGWDFYNDDNSPDDDFGHGTHVAGIIAARANNGIGMAGVAFNAKVMPLKACGNSGDCPAYFVAGAIIYAADMGAQVINLSLASNENSSTLQGAVNYALSRNVTVVAAAGNSGDSTVEYPAAYPGVIAAGAHDSSGTIWSGSTHNSNVDISAPGVTVKSLWPAELDTTDGITDGFMDQTGTSMASAYVSGTSALLISAKVATTPATVMDALACGAEDAGTVGRDDYYGYGRLKADLAMNWNYNAASCKVTLPNDNFESAKVITTLPFSYTQPVSDRSVTEQTTDPAQICGVSPEQTLWYSYKPTVNGYYQFSTLGSSYSNVIGVYRGGQGVLTSVGCTVSGQLPVSLDAAQTYYFVVGTNGAPVNNQILQVRVNPVMLTNNLDYQESSTAIAYVGMWQKVAVTGASSTYTQQTSDTTAIAAFSFRGNRFDYIRTIGPDRGQVKIYINGVFVQNVNNQAAVQKANQAVVPSINVPGGTIGGWNTVYIVRDPTVPGIIDIDRIRTYDFDHNALAAAVTSKADDAAANLRYLTVSSSSDWTKQSYTGAYGGGKVAETTIEGAGVAFRFSGNALTLFRVTGPSGFADMQVTIDNNVTLTVSNTAATPAIRPYTIDGLTTMTHVVEIRKLGATGRIQLDAVQAFTLINLAAGTKYDDRSPYLAYRGVWQDSGSVAGAYLSTTRSLSNGSEVSFRFLGNDLCVGYKTPISGLQVYIDGTLKKTIPADASVGIVTSWCMENDLHTLLADTVHYARLVSTADSFPLDYVQSLRYTTLTPALKVVQESSLSFRYGTPADWVLKTTAATSTGTFRPQGGALKSTYADNTTITFYINGTGFILYTAVGHDRGCWGISIDDATATSIDLGGSNLGTPPTQRYRPLGYGISGLTPGIHRVQLTADTNCSGIVPGGLPGTFPVDFDAVRVFP